MLRLNGVTNLSKIAKDLNMIWRFAKNIKKIFLIMILVVFSTDQLKAEINWHEKFENLIKGFEEKNVLKSQNKILI